MEKAKFIRACVVENFLFGDDDGLENNTSFLETGIVDSTGILELVAYIEKNFDIKVEDHDITVENFDSISKIAKFVEKKQQGSISSE